MQYPELSCVLESIEDQRLRTNLLNAAIAFRERQSWIKSVAEAIHAPGIATHKVLLHSEQIVPLTHSESHTRCEVLARLQPRNGEAVVFPKQFLAHIASDPQLSRQFDRVVIQKVFQTQWKTPHTIAINLSAASVEDATLPRFVAQVIATHGSHNLRIIFEITEHQRFEIPVATLVLQELTDLGFEIALDDFMEGESGIRQLLLPVHFLKLDGSIVNKIAEPGYQAIAQEVMAIAQRRNLGVVAEWIETTTQENIIRSLAFEVGVQAWGQGYLYAPMPVLQTA
jgi:EAL domain-containing protein (putative c-di-GMP-specific phosphodiesterase class I)